MVRKKFEIVLVNKDWDSCSGTEQKSAFSFTTKRDLVEFEFALCDYVSSPWRTCTCWTYGDAVKYAQDCAASLSSEKPRDDDPGSSCALIVRERPTACRGGTPHSGKIEVFAVYGFEKSVAEKVAKGGPDAAIFVYSFSTEEDVAEFLRALELIQNWNRALIRANG
jgi:hypothetical protein